MARIDFLGKGDIAGHHLSVPFHTLKVDKKKSVGTPDLDGNLIIHGDNLLALKALLPRYQGKVGCIYIDPPYNTGNEGWCYNDNVNSPMMQEWLRKAVNSEDQTRHDKWLCMMYPRLQLLKELLSDDGVIFISIDDNEQHRLRMIMDEIFGAENLISQIVVQTNPRGRSLRQDIAQTHEYVLMYAKDASLAKIQKIPKSEKAISEYNKSDDEGRYRLLRLRNTGVQFFNRQTRPNLFFPIYVDPSNGDTSLSRNKKFSTEVFPVTNNGVEGCWTWSKDKIVDNPRLVVGKKVNGGVWRIYRKDYLQGESLSTRLKSVIIDKEINHEIGKETLTKILSNSPFDYPKSPVLIGNLIRLIERKDALILDSFAGSGTTAHAVLALNKEDGGRRKFILIECEGNVVNETTIERTRRVIQGIPKATDEKLKKGSGGSFTYVTLGEEISDEKLLSGESMPSWTALARHVFWLATGKTLSKNPKPNKNFLVGRHEKDSVYLLYEPDIKFLQSNHVALTGDIADKLGEKRKPGERILYYAPASYVSQKDMQKFGIIFCQLPWAIVKQVRK